MGRKVMLQVPLVLLAAVIVGAIAFVLWVVALPAMLINPKLIKPVTDKVSQQFMKQVRSFIVGGKKSTPRTSQPFLPPSSLFSGQSRDSSLRSNQEASQRWQQDWPQEPRSRQTPPSSKLPSI